MTFLSFATIATLVRKLVMLTETKSFWQGHPSVTGLRVGRQTKCDQSVLNVREGKASNTTCKKTMSQKLRHAAEDKMGETLVEDLQ